jgi:uncharacterized protein YkwD
MRKVIIFLLIILAPFLGCGDSSMDSLDPVIYLSYNYSTLELELIANVNGYRSSLDLPLLELHPFISHMAQGHNDDMISLGMASHDGFSLRVEILRGELNVISIGENVAYGYGTSMGILNAWIASEGHHRVLVRDSYTHHGLSIRANLDGRYYVTHIFIK